MSRDHQVPGAKQPPGAELGRADDITLLSLNRRLITPDQRFKVRHQPPSKWVLTLDNVGPADDHAYYLCQAGGPAGARFIGGARLNVLGECRTRRPASPQRHHSSH